MCVLPAFKGDHYVFVFCVVFNIITSLFLDFLILDLNWFLTMKDEDFVYSPISILLLFVMISYLFLILLTLAILFFVYCFLLYFYFYFYKLKKIF